MSEFLSAHLIEIIFGLISAGALAFCKYLHSQIKKYKKLLDEEDEKKVNKIIDNKIEPIVNEIEEIRKYAREVAITEKSHMDLIISSYRFRLIQLCKEYIKQGYITDYQYDQLAEFYRVYTGLGGNGQATDYYEKAISLQIKNNN